jgi:hypothetical protein
MIAMGDSTPTQAAIEAFENIENIEVNDQDPDRPIIKVMDESAIGDFFRVVRQTGVERTATERNALEHTVLDSWISDPR